MHREQPPHAEEFSPEECAKLLAHQAFLTGEPVAQLTGEEFAKGARGRLRFLIAAWYEKNGNAVVHVEGVGNVSLDARAVERSLNHGKGRPKIAVFAAIPDILRKGRLIYVEPLRGAKDGGQSLHFAAPIKIGGKDYIADAVLKADSNGSRLYLHNVASTEALQHPPKLAVKDRSSAVAAEESTGKRAASADAGVVRTVLRPDLLCQGRRECGRITTHSLRHVNWSDREGSRRHTLT